MQDQEAEREQRERRARKIEQDENYRAYKKQEKLDKKIEKERREAERKEKREAAKTASGPITKKNNFLAKTGSATRKIIKGVKERVSSLTGNTMNKDRNEAEAEKEKEKEKQIIQAKKEKQEEVDAIAKERKLRTTEEKNISASDKIATTNKFETLIKNTKQELLNKIISEHKKRHKLLQKINLQVNNAESTIDDTYKELINKFYFSHKNRTTFITLYTRIVREYQKILCEHNINNIKELKIFIRSNHDDKNKNSGIQDEDFSKVLECLNFGIYCGSPLIIPTSNPEKTLAREETLPREEAAIQAVPATAVAMTEIDETREEINKLSEKTKEIKLKTETLTKNNNTLRDEIINNLKLEKAAREDFITLMATPEEKLDTEKEIADITAELKKLDEEVIQIQENNANSSSKLEDNIKNLQERIREYNALHNETDTGSGVFGRDTKSKQQHELDLTLAIHKLQYTNIVEQYRNELSLNESYQLKAKEILAVPTETNKNSYIEAARQRLSTLASGTAAIASGTGSLIASGTSALARRTSTLLKKAQAFTKRRQEEQILTTAKIAEAKRTPQILSPELSSISNKLLLLSSILIPITNRSIIYSQFGQSLPHRQVETIANKTLYRQAARGANTLISSGTSALASGTSALASGTSALASGTSALASGTGSLIASGSAALARRTGTLLENTQALTKRRQEEPILTRTEARRRPQILSPELSSISNKLLLLSSILIPITNRSIIYSQIGQSLRQGQLLPRGQVETITNKTLYRQAARGASALARGTSALASRTGSLIARGATSLIPSGTSALASGTSALASGTSALANGSAALASGTGSLIANKTSALARGATTLIPSGTSALANGSAALTSGTSALARGTSALASGTGSLIASGTSALARRTGTLLKNAQALTAQTQEQPILIKATIPEARRTQDILSPELSSISNTLLLLSSILIPITNRSIIYSQIRLSQPSGQVETIAKKKTYTQTARERLITLARGANTLIPSGSLRLPNGSAALASGSAALASGAAALASGTGSLIASGTSGLASGATALASGTASLANGTGSLIASGTSGLASGAARAVSGAATKVSGLVPRTTGPRISQPSIVETGQAFELDPTLLKLLRDFNELPFFKDRSIKEKLIKIDRIIDEITTLDELNRKLAPFNISISSTNISIGIPEEGRQEGREEGRQEERQEERQEVY